MKVLVVGCNGQVGSCLVKQLLIRKGVTLLAVDREKLDITNKMAVERCVNEFKPQIIINAAAYTAVDKAEHEHEQSYAINCDGPRYLAQAATAVNAAFIHISTDYVFSGDKDGAYSESDLTAPQGVYGGSKLAGEVAISDVCTNYIILRTAWVFGEQGDNFVKTMMRLAKTRDSLGVVADQFGGPTYAGDIARALILIAEAIIAKGEKFNDYGIYHFSGLPHVSWYEFAQVIFAKGKEQGVLNATPSLNMLTTDEYPTPAKRPANSKLDTTKITTKFGIAASDWQGALIKIRAYSE
jgi:dTDP-4-dehydrorhamnose reductase